MMTECYSNSEISPRNLLLQPVSWTNFQFLTEMSLFRQKRNMQMLPRFLNSNEQYLIVLYKHHSITLGAIIENNLRICGP